MSFVIEDHPTAAEALLYAMAEMPFLEKDGVNRQEGYNFRSIDAAVATVRPHLLRHGLVPLVSCGEAVPAHPEDPDYIKMPVRLELIHAKSGEKLTGECEGRARISAKGGVARSDPRVIGQAASYGLKTLLIAWFMLAGGDDAVDLEGDRNTEPEPTKTRKARQAEEDPHADRRARLLARIEGLTEEHQAELRAWAKAEKVNLKTGDLDELTRFHAQIKAYEDAAAAVLSGAEPEPEPETSEILDQIADKFAAEDDEPIDLMPTGGAAAPEDWDESPFDAPAADEPETVEEPTLTDLEVCYLVASGGKTSTPQGCTGKQMTEGAKLMQGIKKGTHQRVGNDIVVLASGELLHFEGADDEAA